MAQFVLEILDGDRAGDVVPLGSAPLKIGRKPGNDIVLADEKASGVHAEIAFEGDRHVLRDLGSTNGTLMDGRKITEVVLGSGDTFLVGRVRLRFRSEGQEAAAGSADGFAVDRIDVARLQQARQKSRPIGLLAAALVVVVGAGGYFWWKQGGGAGGTSATGARQKPELRTPGNLLAAETASCEGEEGFDLRVAGQGFAPGADANTGRGSLEAARAEGGADFAVAATSAELKVLPGRVLQGSGYLRTLAGGRGAVRLAFWTSGDQRPFRFRTGTALQAHDGWTRVEVAAAVPDGADRCRLELVALLPQADSVVRGDDVAIVEGGQATAVASKVGEHGTVLGTGSALAIQSNNPEEPATLLDVRPGAPAAELAGMAAADELVLSDVGAALATEVDDRGVRVAATGTAALELRFPADSASGLLARADAGFAGVEANSRFRAAEVLLGDSSTRCLVQLDGAQDLVGSSAGGVYRLVVPAAAVRLQLGFRPERQRAGELLRAAENLAQTGEPGKALDTLRELLATVPHDAETTAQVVSRRAEWQEALGARLQQLEHDLEEATFFDTRGGFERVTAELGRLQELYGDQNLEDPQKLAAMREQAASRLAQLDAARTAQITQRREALAQAFEQAQQPELAALVRGGGN